MEEALSNLRLLDDEEKAIQEDEGAVNGAYQFCQVGRCLTDNVVHFHSLRNTMADLWHPIGGICITELGEKRYLFQFFNEKFMRIRVCLDVTGPLKRKKKVLVGKSMMVYARFKYEKLSLFCFICGKLGWLQAANGSPYITENLASFNHGISINEGKDLRRNFRGFVGNKNLNPNLIPLGSVQYHGNNRQIKGRDGGNDALGADRLVYGPMDLVLDEEDDPIVLLEGKKRQRIVEGPRVFLDATAKSGSMDVSANSGDQSSRAQ
ncbi:hypothetical protein Goshw_011143 [Gossypium schwendimanii]|uniref:DUF4283 domain-containing protein n=1 Tax=Gossypium schwendimanii TaxID=34291 RepID=A0A7J9KKM1_GOSSC|nr:hypothetical protein [Gossypium schwendimanii]